MNDAHLDDARVAAYLDGELPEPAVEEVERHVEACGPCRRELEELADLSDRLDVAVEGVQPPAELLDARIHGKTAGSNRGDYLRAAVFFLLLLVGGTAAADAALPGSPVRDWLGAALRDVAGLLSSGNNLPARRGMALPAGDGAVEVRVTGAPPGATVRVQLTAGDQVDVSAPGGTYVTDPGLIEIRRPAAGEIRVQIPRTLFSVRVTLNGRLLVERAADTLRIPAPATDDEPPDLLFPAGGGPS